jgi:hypothetical protein
VLGAVSSANAQSPPCDAATHEWAGRCGESHGIELVAESCPPDHLILRVENVAPSPLRVDAMRQASGALRTAGAWGASPIGSFANWDGEPPETLRAFDAIVQCLTVAGPQSGLEHAARRAQPRPQWAIATPWRLVGGASLAMLLAVSALVRAHRRKRLREVLFGSAAVLASALATFAFRRLVMPFAFLHQNGQGPSWVQSAMPDATGSQYGVGYQEVYSAAVLWGYPDMAIMYAHAILLAFVPAVVWALARRAGAGRALATAVAFGIAIDPTLARIAMSESYHATAMAILFPAGLVLAEGVRLGRLRSWRLGVAVVSCGLLIAQLARVHPATWMPSATIALIPAVLGGSRRRRLRLTVVSALGIALVVVLGAGSEMLAVIQGPMSRWLQNSNDGFRLDSWKLLAIIAPGLLVGLGTVRRDGSSPDRARWLVASILALVMLKGNVGAVGQPSFFHFVLSAAYLPAALVIVVGWVADASAPDARRAASLWASLAVVLSLLRWSAATVMPTDAREQAFWWRQRARIPAESTVHQLASVDLRVLALPLYGWPRPVHTEDVRVEDVALPLQHDPRRPAAAHDYWYRSSLCASRSGTAPCAEFERTHRLARVAGVWLPAIESDLRGGYVAPRLEVALFIVLGPR